MGGFIFVVMLGVNVPRSRFLPVKMTSDLLLVMSNLYKLYCGSLSMSEYRVFPVTPLIKLGAHFSKVRQPVPHMYYYSLYILVKYI